MTRGIELFSLLDKKHRILQRRDNGGSAAPALRSINAPTKKIGAYGSITRRALLSILSPNSAGRCGVDTSKGIDSLSHVTVEVYPCTHQ